MSRPGAASHVADRRASARPDVFQKLALLLLVGVVLSALGLVVIKHRARHAVTELESIAKAHDRIAIEWARLQLEEGARASQGVVERTARGSLGMYLPGAEEVRLLR